MVISLQEKINRQNQLHQLLHLRENDKRHCANLKQYNSLVKEYILLSFSQVIKHIFCKISAKFYTNPLKRFWLMQNYVSDMLAFLGWKWPKIALFINLNNK